MLEEDLKSSILDKISQIFGNDEALEPTGFLIKNWTQEKFIDGGTVCFPGKQNFLLKFIRAKVM